MSFAPKSTKRDDVNFIRIGFNDASDNFLVKFHHSDFDHLKQAMINVGDYNEYNGATVVKAFEKIEHLAYEASFGREGSPVLYIRLKREYGEGIEPGTGTPIGQAEVLNAFQRMKKARADEISVDGYDFAMIRIWWD